jgi:6-pyruvoyl tetrahydropterin synthase/QueD family protein
MGEQTVFRKVRVGGDYLRFSSAHFVVSSDMPERLHGHNYTVQVELEGMLAEDMMVFDFTLLKKISRETCRRLHHCFLLPLSDPHLEITEHVDAWEIRVGQKRYRLPQADVVALPIENTSAGRLAEYLCHELLTGLAPYKMENLSVLRVGVEEAPAPLVWYQIPLVHEGQRK